MAGLRQLLFVFPVRASFMSWAEAIMILDRFTIGKMPDQGITKTPVSGIGDDAYYGNWYAEMTSTGVHSVLAEGVGFEPTDPG